MPGRILGAVLTGGASSRFGSDKAAARWAGTTLADHAAAAVRPFVAEMIRVGGAGGIADLPRPGLGPLGGIAAALDHGRRHGFASVLTIACDMPLVPAALIDALLRRAPACCTDAPVLGHWPVTLADNLLDRLSSHEAPPQPLAEVTGSSRGGALVLPPPLERDQSRLDEEKRPRHQRKAALSLRRWATDIGALPIAAPGPLANVNTADDLATL